ncbi:MAG: 30S ribosomal protein S6 [Verrucomicrobia bacterium]|nr:30S ribosomal protein S6 [Verrucomicrobiota bacterium]
MEKDNVREYEALFILDVIGKDYGPSAIIERVAADLKKLGATVKDMQKMEKRPFARVTNKRRPSGYYVAFRLSGPPDLPEKIRRRYVLDEDVYRVMITRPPKKKAAEKAEEGAPAAV